MKRLKFLGMVISLFLVSTPLIHSQNANVSNLPFAINFQKLSYYLDLEPFQKNEIYEINSFFNDQQEQLLTGNISQEIMLKNYRQVLFCNLKLMKEALTAEQYKKYLRVINATNNTRTLAASLEPDNNYLSLALPKETK